MSLDTAFVLLVVVSVVMIVAYFVLMKVFPEAVGISGVRAKKIEREHLGESDTEPSDEAPKTKDSPQ